MRLAVVALSLVVTSCNALDAFRETEVSPPSVVDSSTTPSELCRDGDDCSTPGAVVRTCGCGEGSINLVCCNQYHVARAIGCQDTWVKPSCDRRLPDTGTLDVAETLGCDECRRESCRDEQLACETDAATSGCNALFMCINACSDSACANGCLDAGNPEGRALVECLNAKCADACS